ncbi:MAG: proline--tRNA ligase, partial [Candidatus Thorarchaeota archaeon]|nr:proline--tRNA ligase [Candidatus Thorarchaeota archaeon]
EDIEITKEVVTDHFGIPVMMFKRTQWDKFPGGFNTYAADTLMPDGKVIQLPSTHDLGDNFARAFDVTYLDENNETVYAWQTCYGPAISRIYGAMISIHGDDKGLRLPFTIAPYQVVVIPIYKEQTEEEVMAYCNDIVKTLRKAGIRVHLDKRDQTPGWKYNYWEMKGVPIRVEAGPRDIKNKKVVVMRRDTMEREIIDLSTLKKTITTLGKEIDVNLRAMADSKFEGLIVDADNMGGISAALENGKIARVPFCTTEMEGLPCDEEIKDKTGGEVRGTRTDVEDVASGVCVNCGKQATEVVYVARSY